MAKVGMERWTRSFGTVRDRGSLRRFRARRGPYRPLRAVEDRIRIVRRRLGL
jgi:hypothetical protein